MRIRNFLSFLLVPLIVVTGFPPVRAAEPSAFPLPDLSSYGAITGMQRIPTDGFQLVELGKGRIMLISQEGHYAVVGGRIMDFWNGLEIKSLDDLKRSNRIPASRLPPEGLGAVKLGEGPRITLFIDPLSPTTGDVLSAARDMSSRYAVHLVLLPTSKDRTEVSRRLLCLEPAEALKHLGGELSEASLPPGKDGCGREKLQRNLVAATLFRVRKVPFVVAANGAFSAGLPDDYRGFFDDNTE